MMTITFATEIHLWEIILGAVAVLGVAASIWDKGFVRLGRVVGEVVDFVRAKPVLLEIAERFRPNGGTSLYDTIHEIRDLQQQQGELISTNARAIREQTDAIAEVKNMIGVFVLNQQPGGQRVYDPPE